MIITIHGTAGSGKSTLGRMLATRLNIPFYDMGSLRKKYAKEQGLTIAELNEKEETDPYSDVVVDQYQQDLAGKLDNFVLTCRAGYHFIPRSTKILLKADYHVAGKRVFEQGRSEESFDSIEAAAKSLKERDESDARRFSNLYGLDINDPANFDLIIDTTHLNPLEKMEKILTFLEEKRIA